MVKIHWIVYIVLGSGVLFASYRIDPKKFAIFIWLGYLFLIIGIAKLGIWFVNRPKETSQETKQLRFNQQRSAQNLARFCFRCRAPLHGYENFCYRCGQQLRRFR